jgi:transcriptional regulator with XRE-family HTH domain
MIEQDEETLTSRERLRRDLLEDEEFRSAYAESFLNTFVAAQIKALREQRGMTQSDLAEAIGTKQAGVSRLENVNYSAWKTETLRRIARALRVRLRISFEDFGSLVGEVEQFNRESLQRAIPTEDVRLKHPAKKQVSGSTSVPLSGIIGSHQAARRSIDISLHRVERVSPPEQITASTYGRPEPEHKVYMVSA